MLTMWSTSWIWVLIQVVFLSVANGFSFNISTPTQCNQLTVQWDGGTAPFRFILVPTITVNNGRILNISIPSTVTGPPYSYSFQLSAPSSLKFVATMSDSTGFGAGGTTSELTVGSGSDSSCLQAATLYDFYFSVASTSPAQCSNLAINWESNVTLPVNLYGMIPHGTSFPITIPQSSSDTSINWPVDIASGTQFLLLMSDNGPYVTGGSTSLMTVGSGSTGCMTSSSPAYYSGNGTSGGGSSASGTGTSSTAASTSSSVAGQGGSSAGGSNNSNTNGSSTSSTPIGAIVGGVVGGVAVLVLLALLWFCCFRKRRSSTPLKSYGVASEKRQRRPMDLLGRVGRQQSDEEELTAGGAGVGRRTGQTELHGGEYEPVPFRYPSPPPANTGYAAPGSNLPTGAAPGMLPPLSFQALGTEFDKASHRQSVESGNTVTTTTGTGTGFGPGMTTTASSQPSSQLGQSDHLNQGGAAGVGRSASTRKPVPASAGNALGGGNGGDVRTSGETRPTFVQHEDSGEVVDLPPRYDQLRARNPDIIN